LTGVTGFKPSSGAVPMRGVFPLSPSLDHVGVLSRTAAGCAAVFAHLSGSNAGHGDGNGSDEFGVHKLRIGLVTSHLAAAEKSVRDVTERAVRVLEQLGTTVEPVNIPYEAEVCQAGRIMVRFEAAQIHRSRLANADCIYGDDVRERLAEGLAVTAEAYRQARRERLRLVADINRELSDFDILAGPTTPIPAPELDSCRHPGGGLVQGELLRNTYCYNVTGQPAISIPCGMSPDGLPVGLQLAAAAGQDWLVLRLAMALQAASVWHQARPAGKAVLR
jgi:aspartyl-tRNA(Asn)/glutamyl-tRNA(Gln) amidotransferase subunit A